MRRRWRMMIGWMRTRKRERRERRERRKRREMRKRRKRKRKRRQAIMGRRWKGVRRRQGKKSRMGSEEEEVQEAGKGVGEEERGGFERGGRVGVQGTVDSEEGAGREEHNGTMGGNDVDRDAENDDRDADNDDRDADNDDRDADSDDSMMTQPEDEATWQSLIEQSTHESDMESAREGGRRKGDELEAVLDSQEGDIGGGGRIRVEEEQEREVGEPEGKGKKGEELEGKGNTGGDADGEGKKRGELGGREEMENEDAEGREKGDGDGRMMQISAAGRRAGKNKRSSEGRGEGRGEEGKGEEVREEDGRGEEGRGEEGRRDMTGDCAKGGREEERLRVAEDKLQGYADTRCVQDEVVALEEGEGTAMGEFDFEPPSFSLHVQPSEIQLEPDLMNFLPSQGLDAPSFSLNSEAPPKSPRHVQPSELRMEPGAMNLLPSQGLDAPSFSLGLEGWDGEEGSLGDGQCMAERDGQQGVAEKGFEWSQGEVESTVGDGEGMAKREAWEGKQGAVEQRVAVGRGDERRREDAGSREGKNASGDVAAGRVESGKKVKVEMSGSHAEVADPAAGNAGGAAVSGEGDGRRRFKRLRKAVEVRGRAGESKEEERRVEERWNEERKKEERREEEIRKEERRKEEGKEGSQSETPVKAGMGFVCSSPSPVLLSPSAPELAAATPSPTRRGHTAAAAGTTAAARNPPASKPTAAAAASATPSAPKSVAPRDAAAAATHHRSASHPWRTPTYPLVPAPVPSKRPMSCPTMPRLPQTWFRTDDAIEDEFEMVDVRDRVGVEDIEDTPPEGRDEGEAGERGEEAEEGEGGEEREGRCGVVEGLRRRLFLDGDDEGWAADAPQHDVSEGAMGTGFNQGRSSVVQPPSRFTDSLQQQPSKTQTPVLSNGGPRPGFGAPHNSSHVMQQQQQPSAQTAAVSDPMQRAPPTHTPAATPALSDIMPRPISVQTLASPALSEATRQLLQRRLPHLQLVDSLEERGCDANGDPVFIDYRNQFGTEPPSGADADRGGRPFSHATGNENECHEVRGSGFPWPQQPGGAAAGGRAAGNGGAMGGRGLGWQQQLSQQQGGSGRRRGSGGGGGTARAVGGGTGAACTSGGQWVAEGGKKVSGLRRFETSRFETSQN
ncbi:unnamed protein product [Closterium sp. NIES-53]